MKQYPVNLKIDYSKTSNKLTAFFRLVLVIPIIIVLALISSYAEALSLAVALLILLEKNTQSGGLIGISLLLNSGLELLPMGC
jgi:hypothetical protein